jgi:5-methyltetrahydropteroyltriglutamate--homocysteine methyltransferase
VAPEWLDEAQDHATLVAVRDQEKAGLDIVTDGEVRRESYSNRFATALAGLDLDHPGTALDRTGHPNPVPRVVGPIRRTRPVQVRDVEFLRRATDRPIRVTLPGPFTMGQQAQNEYYPDTRSMALDYAAAVNEELRDLAEAGADIVQIDEPYLQARAHAAREYALAAIAPAFAGLMRRRRCTHASATRRSCTTGPTAIRSSRSSSTVRPTRSRSRRRSRGSPLDPRAAPFE